MHDKRGGGGPKNLHDVIDAWSLEKRESEGVVECGLRWGCVLVVRRFFYGGANRAHFEDKGRNKERRPFPRTSFHAIGK